jgi:hypothetical protein
MPPKKGNSTPNNPSDSPTWTLDEGEEMRRDINDLQKKEVTKDELQGIMDSTEAKLEEIMDTKMDGLKRNIMEGLKHFITERPPGSENLSHEIHDQDTREMNQEWRKSNFGLKAKHFPKMDMRSFDGKDPITWILHIEKFFDLHDVPHIQKVRIVSLYLEPNQFL